MKRISLSIPTPCHENWDAMTPQQQGRFCGSCQKTVVDFTRMTDQQVLDYFSKMHGGNTCGRFGVEQLDRDIVLQNKRRIPWFKYFLNMMIPGMIASKAYSQGQISTKPNVVCASTTKGDTVSRIILGRTSSVEEQSKKVIRGRVLDDRGQSIAGATIKILGTNQGVAANLDGAFALIIKNPANQTLVVSSVGFQTVELKLSHDMNLLDLKINLFGQLSGEVVLVGYARPKKKKILFHQFKDTVADTLRAFAVKIYPNPIRPGNSITIEYKAKKSGNYEIAITDMNGKIVQTNKLISNTNLLQENIALNGSIVPGSYFMVMTDSRGKRMWEKKIIVQ